MVLMKSGLVIGLPFGRKNVTHEWALGMMSQSYPLNMKIEFAPLKNRKVDEARIEIAKYALKQGARYLWFVDDDTAPPSHAARKLIIDLEMAPSNVMVAAGIYSSRDPMPEPMVFKDHGAGAFWHWKYGEVFECSGIATGCMMIKTEVFRHLPEPWFKTVDYFSDREGVEAIEDQHTDDVYFCEKVINAGFKILADGGVLPIHWDNETQIPYYIPEDSYPFQGVEPPKRKVVNQ
jgi:hypothetical protein